MDSNAATAAGSSQQSTKLPVGNRPDETICRICNNELKYRQPKLLPCLHTVCSECLQKCSEGNPQASSIPTTRCPVCRQMFSSKDIVDNYFVLGLGTAKSPNPPKVQNTCTSCDDNAQSSWFCENCVEWLCDACKQAHQRVKLTKEHKVSAIASAAAPQEYSSKKWFPQCNIHAGQVQWLFCVTCEVLICQMCQAAFHRLHRTEVVGSAAENLRQLFKGNFMVRLNEKLQQVTQVKEMISKTKNEITHHEYEITGKMRSLMEKLVLEITNRIVTLNNQLKESCKKKQNFLERQNLEVTHLERALSRCQEFLKTTLSSNNDAAVASCKRTIDKQVEFLLRREPTKMPIAGLELTFLLNDNCNILKQIGSLGQLIIKDPLNHIKIPASGASLTGGISQVGAPSSNGLSPAQQGRQNDLIQANLQNMSPAVRGMVTKALQGIDQRNRAFTINHQPQPQQQPQSQPQPHPQPQPQTSSAISAPLPPPSIPRIAPKPQFNQVQALRLPNQAMTLSVMKTLPSPVISNGSKGDVRPNQQLHRRPVPILPRPAATPMKESDLRIPSITPNSVRSLSEQDILLHIPSIVDEISRTNNSGELNNASTSQEGTSSQQPTVVLERRDSDSGTQNITSPSSQPPSTSNNESRPSSSNSSAAASGSNTDDEIKIKPEPGTESSGLSSCQKETAPVNTDVVADGKYRIWSGQLTWRESSEKSKEPGPLSTVKCHFHDFHTDAPTSISVSSWPDKFSMHLLPRHYIKSIETHIKGAKKLFIEFDKDDENKKEVDKITSSLLADMVGIACYFTGPTKIGVFIVACIRRLQKYVALVPAQQKEVLRTLRDVAGDKMRVYLQEIAKQQPKPVQPATVPEAAQQPSTSSSSSAANTSAPAENHSGKLANISSMLDQVENEYTNVPKKSNPDDPNEDWCAVCQNGGDLLCCDSCPRVFHLQCHIPPLLSTPNDSVPWSCTFCQDVTDDVPQSHMGNGNADHMEEGSKEGEEENGRKRKREESLTERERQLCERVLLELFCNQSSIPFREPVSQDVPGYYTIITNAMDLSTIKARLVPSNSEYYQSVDDMLSDLKLMFSNCFAYNGTEASISQMAKTLQRHLNRLVNQFLPDYGSDLDRNDPTWSGEDRASKRKRKPKDIVHIK